MVTEVFDDVKTTEVFSNVKTAQAVLSLGIKKANTPGIKVFLLGVLGGLFIALGFYGTITIMASVQGSELAYLASFLGALVFPVGLILVLLVGADLFTGNVVVTLAVLDKKAKLTQLLNNWAIVWVGNFVGSIITAFLIAHSGEVTNKIELMTFAVIHKKMALSGLEIAISAFFCNILVVLAVWISFSTEQVIGKIFAVFFPIFVFVIAGFQHCVANMFLFSFGLFLGYEESILHMVSDLAMATLGNAISGGIVIPLIYYYLFIKE